MCVFETEPDFSFGLLWKCIDQSAKMSTYSRRLLMWRYCRAKPDASVRLFAKRDHQIWSLLNTQNYSNDAFEYVQNVCNQIQNGMKDEMKSGILASPIPSMTSFAWQPAQKCWWNHSFFSSSSSRHHVMLVFAQWELLFFLFILKAVHEPRSSNNFPANASNIAK